MEINLQQRIETSVIASLGSLCVQGRLDYLNERIDRLNSVRRREKLCVRTSTKVTAAKKEFLRKKVNLRRDE